LQIFVFQFVAEKTPEGSAPSDLRCAVITVWALGKSIERTEPRVRNLVTAQGWTPVDAPYVYSPTQSQLAALQGREAEAHREALEFGISADVDYWPEGSKDHRRKPPS
jgi:hypothetical protein